MFTKVSLRACAELATSGSKHQITYYSLYLLWQLL